MKKIFNPIVTAILAAIELDGPMTTAEISRAIGLETDDIYSIISRMMRKTPRSGRRLHISGWTDDAEGLRTYPRAIYSVGDKPNKTRPADIAAKAVARRRQRKQATKRVNSVWGLALSQRVTRAQLAGIGA
jgi:hypothetical protein